LTLGLIYMAAQCSDAWSCQAHVLGFGVVTQHGVDDALSILNIRLPRR